MNAADRKVLVPADFAAAATILDASVAAIRAVAEVESKGGGFLLDGRPLVLFEAHVFSRYTLHQYDQAHPDISCPTWNRALYKGGAAEHERLQRAAELNRDAALKSASWGMFQLMGFNFARCGFQTLQEFINGMYRSEGVQLRAFCRFVRSMGLDDELRRCDWPAFAAGYNGPAYAVNHYDTRMAQAFAKHDQAAA